MSQIWEKMSKEEQNKVLNQIATQRTIEEEADIPYQCYYEKIDLYEFWRRRLENV